MSRIRNSLSTLCRFGVVALVTCVSWSTPTDSARPYAVSRPDPVLETWRWRSYPFLEGRGVRSMTEDDAGRVWFGTDAGAISYDGLRWRIHASADGLPAEPVNTVAKAHDGGIFAGTDQGIYRYDGESWYRAFPPAGGAPWAVYGLHATGNGVWAASYAGVVHLGDEGTTVYTSSAVSEAVATLYPGTRVVTIPNSALPLRRWAGQNGIKYSMEIIRGTYTGVGRLPKVIWQVAPRGPAGRAGVLAGDQVLAVNGQPYRRGLLAVDRDTTTLTVLRGAADTVDVTFAPEGVDGGYRDFVTWTVDVSQDGTVWIGFYRGEILRYVPSTGSWRLFTADDGADLGRRPVISARSGDVWVVSDHGHHGIARFDGTSWWNIPLGPDLATSINNAFLRSSDGTIWVGGAGLLVANPHLERRTYTTAVVPSIPQVRIVDLLEASDGSLWVLGLGRGASRLSNGTVRWDTINDLAYKARSPDGARWFLTSDGAVVSEREGRWEIHDRPRPIERAQSMIVDSIGEVWIAGTDADTAATAVLRDGQWRIDLHPRLSWGIEERSVVEAADGELWFGGADDIRKGQLGGVVRYNRHADTWTQFSPPQVPVAFFGIGEVNPGVLFFAAQKPVLFDGGSWIQVEEPEAMVRSWIMSVRGDGRGRLWVGTTSYGVFEHDIAWGPTLEADSWRQHTIRHGLGANTVKDIVFDDRGVWVLTDRSISRYSDGSWTPNALPTELLPTRGGRALTIDARGDIWINRREGTTRYRAGQGGPETRIMVSADEVPTSGVTTILWDGIDAWGETAETDLQFRWRLNGGPWESFSQQTSLTLTDLDPGRYVFEVVARDLDMNVDPTPAVTEFAVLYPIYLQPWFLLLLLAAVILVGAQTVRVINRDRRLVLANERLESALERLVELDQMKSEFFSNVSHELRTPLTAIKGYVDNLLDGISGPLSEAQTRSLTRIRTNADRQTRLISDLLDLQRIERDEADLLQLNKRVVNAADVVRDVVDELTPVAEREGLGLSFRGVPLEVDADPDRLAQIITNLVGNAIKFTARGGRIDVVLDAEGEEIVTIAVIDTGRGIPEEELDRIFDRFHQVRGTRGGTGLGLPITKELVDLHGGRISVESDVGRGSRFVVRLPRHVSPPGV